MKLIVVANWKCNPVTQIEAERLFDTAKKGVINVKNVEIVICPPFLYIPSLITQSSPLTFGAQDCFYEQSGAYTGGVSPVMLKEICFEYVIIGHSERRYYFCETDEMINKKLLAVLKARLKPIFCVGEKEGEEINLVVKEQIEKGLKDINKAKIENLVIAYEPVWAVGTGNPCNPDAAMRATLFIRQTLSRIYNRKVAEGIPVLYGGSVNSKIAVDYIKEAKMNGLLVGGASLDAGEFIKIVKQISEF